MKHPEPHEWAGYLYREADSTTRSRLKAHLAECEPCRARLEAWQGVRQKLDAWKLPRPAAKPPLRLYFPAAARWAAAAVLLITLGFALGRSGGASPETIAALRDDLHAELSEMVKAQVDESTSSALAAAQGQAAAAMREFVDLYEADRSAANQAISSALARLDAAYVSLRRDLETVALNSDVGLRQTQQQLVRLADYSQAGPFTPPN